MEYANPFALTDRRILVTGASSGLGHAIALACARMGAEVLGVGRDEARLRRTKLDLETVSPLPHRTIRADLTRTAERDALVMDLGGPVSGVVHSAGISRLSPVRMITE